MTGPSAPRISLQEGIPTVITSKQLVVESDAILVTTYSSQFVGRDTLVSDCLIIVLHDVWAIVQSDDFFTIRC